MEIKNLNVNFFFLILLCISVITFFIFQPFFIAILLAAILAVIFQKPFKFFLRITGKRTKISAFLTAFFGILIFGGLFLGVVGLTINEVSTLYQRVATESSVPNQKAIDQLINNV